VRVIARTSRNTGVSAGPLGLVVLLIGGLIYLVAMAIVMLLTFIAAGIMLAVGETKRRRAAPQITARRG
jgi:hypothetical protein